MVLILLRQLHVGITDEQKKLQRIICSISSPKQWFPDRSVFSNTDYSPESEESSPKQKTGDRAWCKKDTQL